MAFTLDDLPAFPHLPLPDGDTPQSVATRIIGSLDRNGVSGVFALANSWPLDVDPEYARILDDWITGSIKGAGGAIRRAERAPSSRSVL